MPTGTWRTGQLELALLGAFVQLGWSKTGDPAELGWWTDRVLPTARQLFLWSKHRLALTGGTTQFPGCPGLTADRRAAMVRVSGDGIVSAFVEVVLAMSGWLRWRTVPPVVAVLVAMCALAACGDPRRDGAELARRDAVEAVVAAAGAYPLVALGEYHRMQQWHDFMAELLRNPEFAELVDDIVVEFGNALYQDVADRFIVELEPVELDELAQIWRNTIGGRVLWDAPVYEQFFRNVRRLNDGLPADRRVRVLLGDPDVNFDKVHSATDFAELDRGANRDAFYAEVVRNEVIAKNRRAVLIAGADHLRRGVHANTGPDDPTVATLLGRSYPGELFIFYPLPFEYDRDVCTAVEETLRDWPSPSAAILDGTWLGAQHVSHRAMDEDFTFADQVDAVLWFGPATSLTASQPDPQLYRSGAYATELRRRGDLLAEYFDEPINYIQEGLELANSAPGLVDRC